MVNQIVKNWLDKANDDMAFAKASLHEGLEFYPQICFYLHQSVEKYLKAYIIANKLDFKRIHDLTELVRICTKHDPAFNIFYKTVKFLNPFYIGTRYPDFIISVNKSNTEKALQISQEIAVFIKSKLE